MPLIEAMLTIAPPPVVRIAATAARATRKVPTTLTSRMRRNSAAVISSNGLFCAIPAELTTPRKGPIRSAACACGPATAASSVTSSASRTTRSPHSASSASALSSPAASRSAIATLQPSAASCRAAASPIPDAPPVTNAPRSFTDRTPRLNSASSSWHPPSPDLPLPEREVETALGGQAITNLLMLRCEAKPSLEARTGGRARHRQGCVLRGSPRASPGVAPQDEGLGSGPCKAGVRAWTVSAGAPRPCPAIGARLTIRAMPRPRGRPRSRPAGKRARRTRLMQKLSRRDVFRATAGFAVAAPAVFRVTQGRAADFSLKYANNSPVTHPLTIRTIEAMDAIRKETGGKVDIQVFPNNQLGGDTDMLSQLRLGA